MSREYDDGCYLRCYRRIDVKLITDDSVKKVSTSFEPVTTLTVAVAWAGKPNSLPKAIELLSR